MLDLGLKEAEARNENYKADHEELVHLRNYVFQMTEDEKDIPEVNIREMERVLKEKKIVIIGGHSNWTYKLKNKFPRWVFFKPEISNTFWQMRAEKIPLMGMERRAENGKQSA